MARPTLRDLAEATGLSVSTVSRALAGSTRISAATRERVRAEARRQGYEADLAASLLRRRDVRHVGLVCRLDQELHFAYRRELIRQAEAAGVRLMVQSVDSSWTLEQALSSLRQMRCRAAVLIDPASFEGLSLSALGMPAVLVGQGRNGMETDLVTSDNTSGMAQAAAHLAKLGHRQLVYLDGPTGCSAEARRRALLAACEEQGLRVRVVSAGAGTDDGFDAVGGLLGGEPAAAGRVREAALEALGATAVVCYNDQCAQGAIVALARRGLLAGRDVAVTGCDNTRIAASRTFDLTSIDRRTPEVARRVIGLIASRLDEPDRPAVHEHVMTQLVVRGSSQVPVTAV